MPWQMGVIDVGWAMAGGAAHSRGAEAIGTAHHKRLMGMLVLALQRTVGCRVAVHAPRMRDDLAGFLEQGDGTVLVTLDFGEIAQRPQGFGCRRLGAGLGVDAAGDQGRQCREEGDGLEVHLFAPHAFGTARRAGRECAGPSAWPRRWPRPARSPGCPARRRRSAAWPRARCRSPPSAPRSCAARGSRRSWSGRPRRPVSVTFAEQRRRQAVAGAALHLGGDLVGEMAVPQSMAVTTRPTLGAPSSQLHLGDLGHHRAEALVHRHAAGPAAGAGVPQPAFSAARFSTARCRGCLGVEGRRYSTGSLPRAPASWSMVCSIT